MQLGLLLFGNLVLGILAVPTYRNSPFNLVHGFEHIVVPVDRRIFTESRVTLITCGILCSHDVRCKSIEYRPVEQLCTGSDVTTLNGCANFTQEASVLHFEKLCYNGGRQNATGQCSCVGGWIGSRCERIMKNCLEGWLSQRYRADYYLVHPTLAPEPFTIRCNYGSFAMLRRNKSPTENFNRPFQDYKNGFGDAYANMWVGLDNLYYLTQDVPYTLSSYIYIQNATRYRSRQIGFKIGNESTGYRMTFENSVKNVVNDTLGDCMEELKGQLFSTYDSDNDNATNRNCAAEYGGGYWFNACSSCNPVGEVTRPPSDLLDNFTSEVFWKENLGDVAPYQILQMLHPMRQRINGR